ncbi:hypothetical protein BJV74DRAFT_767068, partial [Russula compacta]
HFLTQIPHPMQRNSEMKAILSVGFTSIQNDTRTFLHSCAQRLGLQRLSSTIAMRVILSAIMVKNQHNRRDNRCSQNSSLSSPVPQCLNRAPLPRGFDQ